MSKLMMTYTPRITPNVTHPCHHSKTTCLCEYVCARVCTHVCLCVPAAAARHLSPLIPAYIFTTGHAIVLASSSAGQGTLWNILYESVMTSQHAYSCYVNMWTPEAKEKKKERDIVKTTIVSYIAHFNHCHWPDAGCVLIQCLDKNYIC